VVAAALFLGVLAYSLFAGADFGSGFFDLTAGGSRRGAALRTLIDHSIGPVWEANHVWLIYILVIWWTGFPTAFAAATSTLFVPLLLALLGIVLRGAGFAFRKYAATLAQARLFGVIFAGSSLITPFFLGTVAGGIASGRVPTGGYGDPVSSWANPTSLLGGALAVLVAAFVAAVFLTAEARRRADPELEGWYQRRAQLIAVVTGVVALAGIAILHADSPRLFHGLLSRGLPLVLVSGLCGLAALLLLPRAPSRLLQGLAVVAAGSVIAGWGVAQYPYLLGTHLRIQEAAAPTATLWALTIVAALALALVVPGIVLLFVLQQRGQLEGVD
jgi:cytochrome d ubiquinol oxidase subunit II